MSGIRTKSEFGIFCEFGLFSRTKNSVNLYAPGVFPFLITRILTEHFFHDAFTMWALSSDVRKCVTKPKKPTVYQAGWQLPFGTNNFPNAMPTYGSKNDSFVSQLPVSQCRPLVP